MTVNKRCLIDMHTNKVLLKTYPDTRREVDLFRNVVIKIRKFLHLNIHFLTHWSSFISLSLSFFQIYPVLLRTQLPYFLINSITIEISHPLGLNYIFLFGSTAANSNRIYIYIYIQTNRLTSATFRMMFGI